MTTEQIIRYYIRNYEITCDEQDAMELDLSSKTDAERKDWFVMHNAQ